MKYSVHGLALVLLIAVSACSTNGNGRQQYFDNRTALAKQLENEHRLADALVQWQALAQMFPDNPDVINGMAAIESKIGKQKNTLLKQIDAVGEDNATEAQKLYLKLLAIEPANQFAIEQLREYEKRRADTAANLKAYNIKRVFVAKKQKSEKAQDLQRFTADASELFAKGNFSGLLQLVDVYLEKYPQQQGALRYRYQGLLKMAESELAEGNEEEAVELFERAMKVKNLDHSALMVKTTSLKKRLSDEYFRRGMKQFKNDIDKAVDYLQTSVGYNPDNLKAYQQLIRATRIQQNLRKIQGSSK